MITVSHSELTERPEMNGLIIFGDIGMYTVCGEISSRITHSMYSGLWNPSHMPERFMTRATRSGIPQTSPASPACLPSAAYTHSYRSHTYGLRRQQSPNGFRRIGSHLRFAIKICNSAEPQTSTRLQLCFGNRVSAWKGMNVQMCYRWDSLKRDLAHWYSLCTITALQNRGVS